MTFLRGLNIAPEPGRIELGIVPCTSVRDIRFVLRNLSGQEIRILGIKTSCSCTAARNYPRILPARGVANIDVQVHLPDRPERFAEEVVVTTSDVRQQQIRLGIGGQVEAAAAKKLADRGEPQWVD